ncbi:MAG: HXXEE domain-containing protein [Chloroflexi bacterium]|nr:HXXEE domain-containing protein [Chloroflexota bacterium]
MVKNSQRFNLYFWLVEHWPKATIFLAIYTFVLLYLYLFEENQFLFLLWVQTPVYWLHQFEEYVYPGGFATFFNQKLLGSGKNEWPVTKTFSFWINIPIIFVAFPLSTILAGSYGFEWGIWIAYFSILNALSHVGMFFRFGYNPGFVVSLLLNIPIGVYTLYTFFSDDVLTTAAHIMGVVIAFLIQGGLMIWGLVVLKGRVQQQTR